MGGLAFLMDHAASPVPPAGAAVASSQAMSEAYSLAQTAQSLAEARQPVAALTRYRSAYELSRDPSLLLELGRLEREVGNSARAAFAFEQFLQQAGSGVLPSRKQLVTRQLQAAAVNTARVNLQTNVVDAVAELEPQRGVATGSGFVLSVLLDAGERRINLSKPGYETRSVVLSLQPGEVRSLRVDLDKAAAGRSDTSSGKLRWSLVSAARRDSSDI